MYDICDDLLQFHFVTHISVLLFDLHKILLYLDLGYFLNQF